MSGQFNYGPDWLNFSTDNLGSSVWGFARDELLGYDDFQNMRRRFGEGDYLGAGLSALTGTAEAGLTGLAILGSGPTMGGSLVARGAVAGGRFGAGRLLGALNPWGGTALGGRLRPAIMQAGRFFAGGAGGETPELDEPAEDAPPASLAPFNLNLGGAGGRGGAGGVRPIDTSWIEQLMPISDYETMLANQLDQISARSSAFSVAAGDTWDRVQTANRAASAKAIEMGAEFGELGRQRWHEAAEGALNIAAARAESIGMMSGGLPQTISPSGVTEDFAQFARATGEAEASLQEGLGQMRAADLDWMAESAGQAGAGYQAEFARAEQDLTASAVQSHNNRVIERNNQIAQMRFAAAMQSQQLNAQAAMANASRGSEYQDVYNLAANLRGRPGLTERAAASMLAQTFPEVFGSPENALAFYSQLGDNPA